MHKFPEKMEIMKKKNKNFAINTELKKFQRNSQDFIIKFTEFTAPSSVCAFCRSYTVAEFKAAV